MFKKIIAAGLLAVVCLGIFTACDEYRYEFYFSVVGENGSILNEWGWDSPIFVIGGKTSGEKTFVATPDSGYQVKQWTYNGEIVEGNKSNILTTKRIKEKRAVINITVEFEPIPQG